MGPLASVLLAILVLGVAAYIRLAPSDPARWHVRPTEAQRPADGGWLLRPEGGDAVPETYKVAPERLLAAIDAVARAAPRTRVLAGSVAEGHLTYVTRSRLWGFPDYTSVEAVQTGTGAAPAIFARLRFGRGDMGVNRARVERWQAALAEALR